jgi:hypothetical protein
VRKVGAVGAAIVALYVLVDLSTLALSHQHVRPLFEGVGPGSGPYQWVNPPKAFAATNVPPHVNETDIPLGPTGTPQAGATSSESQLLLNLPAGAIPPSTGATAVHVKITPLDPAKLGPAPAGTVPNGNAYKVELTYKPGDQPITILAKPGNIVLAVPDPGVAILSSPDGLAWQRLPTQQVTGPTVLGATFSQPGVYAGAEPPLAKKKSSGNGGVVLVAAITVALALLLGFGPAAYRRLRRR